MKLFEAWLKEAERALSSAERLLFCVKEIIQTAGK
jgi:hypothetical protein